MSLEKMDGKYSEPLSDKEIFELSSEMDKTFHRYKKDDVIARLLSWTILILLPLIFVIVLLILCFLL